MNRLDLIEKEIKSCNLQTRSFLDKFTFINESSKESEENNNLVVYYLIGKYFKAKNFLQVGFGLGLHAAFYLWSNPDVENFLSIQETGKDYYSKRLGVANVRRVWKKPFDVHVGNLTEEIINKNWDIVFINDRKTYESHLAWLKLIWNHVEENGVIFMDIKTKYSKKAYEDFCIIKNKEPHGLSGGIAVLERH